MNVSKRKKCPKGTRRNKKTGECEKTLKRNSKPNSKSNSKSNSKKEMKPDWDKTTRTFERNHNGRIFTFMEIPESTSIFRGFQHGHAAVSERGWGYKPTQEDIKENDQYNLEAAVKAKKDGLYYGTLAVACYYAMNHDNGARITHEVMEFKPQHKLIILDMSVWKNLKNIADDCGEGTEFEKKYGKDQDIVLEETHDFYKNQPGKKLERNSSSIDDRMTQLMMNWMNLSSSPEMDGFGHSMMPGFHSELACVSREKSLKLENVYSTTDRFSHELVNEKSPTDVINMDTLEYMTYGKKKPFKIKELLLNRS